MQHDAAFGVPDPDAEFWQSFPQGAHLLSNTISSASAQLRLLHQNRDRGGEQHPQMVGEEARATGAGELRSIVLLLDPALDFASAAVDLLVEVLWRAFQNRHDQALVVLTLPQLSCCGL